LRSNFTGDETFIKTGKDLGTEEVLGEEGTLKDLKNVPEDYQLGKLNLWINSFQARGQRYRHLHPGEGSHQTRSTIGETYSILLCKGGTFST